MKLYVIKVLYDYATSSVLGVFSSKEKAEEVAAEMRKDPDVLDGVVVSEYTLDERLW